jgi:Leucine-rich repeat (LRR) protein
MLADMAANRQKILLRVGVAALLLALSAGVLLLDTDYTLSVVGLALIASQLVAVLIVFHPHARYRAFFVTYVVVSFLHTYFAMQPEEYPYLSTCAAWKEVQRQTRDWPHYVLYQGHAEDDDPFGEADQEIAFGRHFRVEEVGTLLSSAWLGAIAGLATQLLWQCVRKRGPDQTPDHAGKWYQLNLRTLLVHTTLIALAVGWCVRERRAAGELRAKLDALNKWDEWSLFDPWVGAGVPENRSPLFPALNAWLWQETPLRIQAVDVKSRAHLEALIQLGLPIVLLKIDHLEQADFALLPQLRVKCLEVMLSIHLEEEALQPLGAMTQLQSLRLQTDGLQNSDLRHLAKLTQLRWLDLGSDMTLNDEGLGYLAGMHGLEEIDCHEMLLNDNLAMLAGFPKLTNLSLHAERLGPDELRYLEKLTRLAQLSLSGDAVTDAYVPWISANQDLAKLWVDSAQFSDESLSTISCLPKLENLSLRGATGNEAFSGANCGRHLEHLRLIQLTLSDAALQNIAGFPDLNSLSIEHCTFPAASIAELQRQTSLVSFSLNRGACTDADVIPLAALPKLTMVDLSELGITDATLDAFAQDAPRLGWLDVKKTDVTATGVARFHAARPEVRLSWDGGEVLEEDKNAP